MDLGIFLGFGILTPFVEDEERERDMRKWLSFLRLLLLSSVGMLNWFVVVVKRAKDIEGIFFWFLWFLVFYCVNNGLKNEIGDLIFSSYIVVFFLSG